MDYENDLASASEVRRPLTQRELELVDRLIGYMGEHYDGSELYDILHHTLEMSHDDMEMMGFNLEDYYETPDQEQAAPGAIRALKIEPGKHPEPVQLRNDLDSLQEAVGGLIELVHLDDGAAILCNEEGKLAGLEWNRIFGDDILCGTFYIVGDDGGEEFSSLTDEQVEEYTEQFYEPESFTQEQTEANRGFYFISLM